MADPDGPTPVDPNVGRASGALDRHLRRRLEGDNDSQRSTCGSARDTMMMAMILISLVIGRTCVVFDPS